MTCSAPVFVAVSWLAHAPAVAALSAQEPEDSSSPSVTPASRPDELFNKGEYEAAIEVYREQIGKRSGDIESAVGLARCLMQVGDYDGAQTALDTVDGTVSAAWLTHHAELLTLRGRYEEAMARARRAVEVAPSRPEARLLLGQHLELFGRTEEAIETYRWFDRQLVELQDLPDDPAWLTAAAQGFVRFSVMTRTNVADRTKHALRAMLQPVYVRLDRTYWPARLAAGELLRERYNNDETDGSVSDYEAALRINPRLPQAHVGLARVALDRWDFEQTEERVAEALAVNPRFPPALHVQAERLIVERRYEEAIRAAEEALVVNPRDVVALALIAAAHACRFDDSAVETVRARAEAITPRAAIYHRILGTALSGIRQYADSERELLRAVELDPTDANARNELGLMYMQWGREDQARDVLDAAFQLDPFNQRTKFTLDLLDALHRFSTVETEHVVVRYQGDEDGVVAEAIAGYLDGIYDDVTDDFDTVLDEKTIIEVFPSLREFAVRITGQPWIHTIGACTGRIIALSAPRKAPGLTGPYHFARVVRHEFTHTVTLAATKNRIPHWFTEGLAVMQEDTPRSYAWRRLLGEAIRRDALFDMNAINWAFVRPRRASDRPQAYAQSEWMCEYIVARYGYEIIFDMLNAFREGKTQADVFQNVLKVTPELFSKEFAEWARKQAADWGMDLTPSENPQAIRDLLVADAENPDLLARLAIALLDTGDLAQAAQTLEPTLERNPDHEGILAAFLRLLEAALDSGPSNQERVKMEQEAAPHATRLVELNSDHCAARRLLGDIALRERRWSDAREHHQRLQRICPADPASWRGLSAVYLQERNDNLALPQLLELVRTEEHQADVAAEIARIQRRSDQLADAAYWYREALYIDPMNAEFRRELIETLLRADRAEEAAREAETLIRLQPKDAVSLAMAAMAAQKSGRTDRARELAERAVAIDPASPAGALLR